MRLSLPLSFLLLTSLSGGAGAQSTNYSSADVTAGASVKLGFYAFARKDCVAGPLPTIEVVSPPKHGVFTAKRGILTTGNSDKCANTKLPAQIVFYRSQPNYTGPDQVVYGVKSPDGQIDVYSISITVKEGPAPQSPGSNL